VAGCGLTPASHGKVQNEDAKAAGASAKYSCYIDMRKFGGAGICTRVRKYIPAGIYDAYPPLKCRARREEAAKPPGTNLENISPLTSETTVSSQPA
jgi:hypothetical protein